MMQQATGAVAGTEGSHLKPQHETEVALGMAGGFQTSVPPLVTYFLQYRHMSHLPSLPK